MQAAPGRNNTEGNGGLKLDEGKSDEYNVEANGPDPKVKSTGHYWLL